MERNNRRSIRNFLLNRNYQLRYTAIMVAISVLLTAALGYVWYRQVRETSKVIEVKALTSLSEQEARLLDQEIRRQDLQRLLVLVAFGALMVIAVTLYGIVLTHKVAGPMYKIRLYMTDVQEGRLAPIGGIRKGDHLHEFFRSFREMHEAVRIREEATVKVLSEVVSALDKEDTSAVVRAATQALKDLKQNKEKSLQG